MKPDQDVNQSSLKYHDVVIIGAGAGGIATAASLLKRQKDLDIAIIDSCEIHYYQPRWTMVGGGVFSAESTRRKTETVIPKGCHWYRVAADEWLRKGRLKNIDVSYHSAGQVLFGVEDYVPELQTYIDRYDIELCFKERLIAVDGKGKTAHFVKRTGDQQEIVDRPFDMLHVVPARRAPEFVGKSGLANQDGWIDLDPETLQHVRYPTIFGLGDASGTPNAKTMAAVRKQAPVVA